MSACLYDTREPLWLRRDVDHYARTWAFNAVLQTTLRSNTDVILLASPYEVAAYVRRYLERGRCGILDYMFTDD